MCASLSSRGELAIIATIFFVSCSFSPHPQDGVVPCSVGCPSGYICASDDTCWGEDSQFPRSDAAASVDASPPTGPMVVGRGSHTATLLQTGKVLIAGGTSTPGSISDAELYDPVTETFARTGSLATARALHTATALQDGRVLLVGGRGNGSEYQLSSAELYDPNTGAFAATGSMAIARSAHTATLLPSGKVLIAGGFASGEQLQSAELYDPLSNTFASAGTLDSPRDYHTATLLQNGKVLIAGGDYLDCPFSYPNPPPCEMVFFGQAELYYPAAGIFTVPTCSSTEGTELTATLLGNGRVLVAGGETYTISDPITTTILSSAELYDPVAGSFTAASSLIVPRVRHTATLLQDATVLFAGGSGSTPASAELYEPDADEFVPTGFLNVLRESHTATLLPNGQVLIAGGFGETGNQPPLASAEIYDPLSRTFADVGTASSGRFDAGSGDASVGALLEHVDSGDSDGAVDAPSFGRVSASNTDGGVDIQDIPYIRLVDSSGGDGGARPSSVGGEVDGA